MDENASDTSENYLQIVTKKDKLILFCKLYWRMIVVISTAFSFLPIAYIGKTNAYAVLYIFLLCSIYWAFDVLHPGLVGLLPIVMTTLLEFTHHEFISTVQIHNHTLDALGVMIMVSAIEHSKVHRRIAVKLLLIFGCSHYRLSFLLFFTTMFLAMWVTNTMACALMIPIVKAVLVELERMGILEVHHNITKGRKQTHVRHEQSNPRPTVFSIFYFLGTAYSSSIGGLGNLMGSESNETYVYYSKRLFPYGPYIDFPHYMLLNLPGVLLMEALLYLWMNFYFMGLFRAQSEIALEIGLTEEEAQYIQTLLSTQYLQLGKITFHEGIVGSLVVLAAILHIFRTALYSHLAVASPIMACTFIFFLVPVNLDFLKFFKKRSDTTHDPYPTAPSKACLNWSMMRDEIHWTVLFISAGTCTIFEALKTSGATDKIDEWLLYLKNWPMPAQSLAVILICKVITEFGDNSCVLGTLLPGIARLSVESKCNPHYLMTAAHLTSGLPFHLIIGTPANAMVAEYMQIHPWKMMKAGFGPSVIAVCVCWFTVTLWAKTIWPDINQYPMWAETNNILSLTSSRTRHY